MSRKCQRWLVETKTGVFQDVGYPTCQIEATGALVFRDEHDRIALAWAAGNWLTVCENHEDDVEVEG